MNAVVRRAAALCIVLLITAACAERAAISPSSATLTAPTVPAPFTGLTRDLRIRWTAEPGVNLVTGAAVIVRAYRESFTLAGLMASSAYYYPGFQKAVPPKVYGTPNYAVRPLIQGEGALGSSGFQITTPIVGVLREHILSLTGGAATGYTALVCSWRYTTGVQQPDGSYRYTDPMPNPHPDPASVVTGTLVYRVTVAPPPAGTPDVAATAQRGTSPNPTTDVFGGWKIVYGLDYATLPGRTGEPPGLWPLDVYNRDLNTCAEKAPDSLDRRRFFTTGEHPKSDYPNLPAYPGWPAKDS